MQGLMVKRLSTDFTTDGSYNACDDTSHTVA